MILARIPLPAFEVPAGVLAMADRPHVYTSSLDVPFGAQSWIACSEAWPHTDEEWFDKVFLTLTVVGYHEFCDAEHYQQHQDDGMLLEPGVLSVVDPLVLHWLQPRTSGSPWVAVQWEVRREQARRKARAVVKQFGGEWVTAMDRRYAAWRPHGRLGRRLPARGSTREREVVLLSYRYGMKLREIGRSWGRGEATARVFRASALRALAGMIGELRG